MRYEEQTKHLVDLEKGKTFVDSNLDCGQAYSVYKFHPEMGEFSPCCDATNVKYDHETFLKLGKDYFEKHPEIIKTKTELRNNIKNVRCELCWKKEAQGIKSMRQALGPRNCPENHQNPYLDVEKSYPSRIELWMNSTCNLGCFMCHLGNSNTLRKIWHEDPDSHGNDGIGFDMWINNLDFTVNRMQEKFNQELEAWVCDKLSDPLNEEITVAYLGGEPTLHNEMFEHADKFIEAARDALAVVPQGDEQWTKRKISIVTNGTSKDALNVRFTNMFNKYAQAGWRVNVMVSQDGTDDAAQVRHGANSEQIMKNYSNWMSPDSVVSELTHFTVLSNLSFPYVHNLLYKIRDLIDYHYSDNPEMLEQDKRLHINFNPCMDPTWMQIRYLPRKFAVHAASEATKVFEYLTSKYSIELNGDIFKSVLARTEESPAQQDVNEYFEKLHYVQSVYRKSFPEWDFYTNFPHLVEFANDYGITRE